MNQAPLDILIVDDSPSDVLMTREALSEKSFGKRLWVVEDGVEALDFVRKKGKYKDVPRPDLILLDLNLPKKDGREVLQEIKGDLDLRLIPVIILTTSRAPEDVIRVYRNYANCYISKPVDYLSFEYVIKTVEHFWFSIATLPYGAVE